MGKLMCFRQDPAIGIGYRVPISNWTLKNLEHFDVLEITVDHCINGSNSVVQTRIPVPFLLENITYMFEWPDSNMSDADFLNLICRETGAGLLLDLENVYINSRNHGFDPHEFIDALPRGLVHEIHLAGGITVCENFLDRPFLADSHSHPVPDAALDLLDRVLVRQTPGTIILERDDRLDATDEILDDVARIRSRIAGRNCGNAHGYASVGSAG